MAGQELLGFQTAPNQNNISVLDAIQRDLDQIGTQLRHLELANKIPGSAGSRDERALHNLEAIVRQATVDELDRLASQGAIDLETGMQLALVSLQRANEEAHLSLMESTRLRKAIESNAERIAAAQAKSRAEIEALMNG